MDSYQILKSKSKKTLKIFLNQLFRCYHTQDVKELRQNFRRGKLRECEARIQQLKQLNLLIEENKDRIHEALYKDLRKVWRLLFLFLKLFFYACQNNVVV